MKQIKRLLLGGSPCTHWSVAQKNNRETKAEGIGWELFQNYVIARDKFNADYFLYENNKSASKEIKEQIASELKVWNGNLLSGADNGVRFTYINSALVSAQNRQRFYVTNWGDIEQPIDRNIVLKDILESGISLEDKTYCLTARYNGAVIWNTLERGQRSMVAEPIEIQRIPEYGQENKSRPLTAHYPNNYGGWYNRINDPNPAKQQIDIIAEPMQTYQLEHISKINDNDDNSIRIGDIGSKSQAHRVYSADGKSVTINAGGGGQGGKTGLYATPIIFQEPHGYNKGGCKYDKVPTLTANGAWTENNKIIEPIKVGEIGNGGQGNRIYSDKGKSVAVTATSGGVGSNTGLYALPLTVEKAIPKIVDKKGYLPEMFNAYNASEIKEKSPTLSTGSMATSSCATLVVEDIKYCNDKNMQHLMRPYGSKAKIHSEQDNKSNTLMAAMGSGGGNGIYVAEELSNNEFIILDSAGKKITIYKVENGQITIKGKQYPIKLQDGYYIIRKLTVKECMRLQTIPEWYEFNCSNSQAYKMLGNGWTVEVIKHLLSTIPNYQEYDWEVLSMYDGMSCGQIALKELGFNVVSYKAYEIDKYAIAVTQHNFANTIQCGDAFKVREANWNE